LLALLQFGRRLELQGFEFAQQGDGLGPPNQVDEAKAQAARNCF
jgi:hypothetical protein